MKHFRSILIFLLAFRLESFADSRSCNDLISGLSPEVQSTIHDLARLRFDLDRRLAQGENDSVTRTMQSQYLQKEKEVLVAARIDRTTLIEKLKSEITSFQETVKDKEIRQARDKKIERDEAPTVHARVIQQGQLEKGRRNHSIIELPGDQVLVVGGYGPEKMEDKPWLTSIELIDFKTLKSKVIGHLKIPRQDPSLLLLSDGQVLVGGGWDGKQFISSIELIDPATGNTQLIGSRNGKLSDCTMRVLPDGQVMIIGRNSIEVFDLNTRESKSVFQWENENPYVHNVLPDGRVLTTQTLGGIELIDPKTNTHRVIGQIQEKKTSYSSTVLQDGRVMLVGGMYLGASYGQRSDSIEMIDPKTGKSDIIGHLEQARNKPGLVTLPSGLVLVIGGYSDDVLSSIELIDPNTGKSEIVGDLPSDHYYDQVLLKGDTVLLVGGKSKSESYSRSILLLKAPRQ